MPLKPAQHAEEKLLVSILSGEYPPGSNLPAERELSELLGVTRPTVREALQRLSRDGWVTIRHGKPTVVNDYWSEGGMGILRSIVYFPEFLPQRFIVDLLEARVLLLGACADSAVSARRSELVKFLRGYTMIEDSPQAFADYDWALQTMMVKNSGNMFYPMLFNDFAPMFELLGIRYFSLEAGRTASKRYYGRLLAAIEKGRPVAEIVRRAMEESIEIWKRSSPD